MEQFVKSLFECRVKSANWWRLDVDNTVDGDSGSGVFAGVPIVASGLVSPTPSLRWWPPPHLRQMEFPNLDVDTCPSIQYCG